MKEPCGSWWRVLAFNVRRLVTADFRVSTLQPSLIETQRTLISAFAQQSRDTWEQWAANLHGVMVADIERGEIDNCRPLTELGLASTPAPIDLFSFLNAPFANIKALMVPSLTNALVEVCFDVVSAYAALQREYIKTVGAASLRLSGSSGGDGTLAAAGVCAVVNNAKRTIEMLAKLEEHTDDGIDEEEAMDEVMDDDKVRDRPRRRCPRFRPPRRRCHPRRRLPTVVSRRRLPTASQLLA